MLDTCPVSLKAMKAMVRGALKDFETQVNKIGIFQVEIVT
jgi:hypothetical protein